FAEAEPIDLVAEMMPAAQPWPAAVEIAEPALIGEAGDEQEPAAAPVLSAETETGIPFASQAERVLEEAVAQAPAAHREEPPQAAPSPLIEDELRPETERPANPRRGWWQRLTQS
ncbi:MAG: hypothetical protein WA459_19105, partial [Stellaceae bacterium]